MVRRCRHGRHRVDLDGDRGVGYRFGWGDVVVGYRHLAYEIDRDKDIDLDMSFSGPGIGAVFRF